MVEIVKIDELKRGTPTGSTSKGDQPKWADGTYWYKADYMGYEGLSEVLVSVMLQHSNAQSLCPYVRYTPVKIRKKDKLVNGCKSLNFKNPQDSIVTLEKLHRMYYGEGLAQKLGTYTEVADRILYTADFVADKTGLDQFGDYLSTIIALDAVFLNEDRHTNNLAVIFNEETEKYRLCPLFDFGLSFLSDMNDYPMGQDTYSMIPRVQAKPFDDSFIEQVNGVNELWGIKLTFNVSQHEIFDAFKLFDGMYDEAILRRVENILREQMQTYTFLFK